MKIIQLSANESGSRPALQDWDFPTLPEGYAWCPDDFVEVFYSTSPSGFVNITVENDTVTEMTINQEALNAYIAEHPDVPEDDPEPVEGVNYDELAVAIQEGVNEV
jgi:hypothetical protein